MDDWKFIEGEPLVVNASNIHKIIEQINYLNAVRVPYVDITDRKLLQSAEDKGVEPSTSR